MKMKKALLALSLTSCAFSAISHADDTPWYVGLSVNQADLDSINTQSNSAVANVTRRIGFETDDDTGFGISFGRNLLTQGNGNTLSLELNYSNSEHAIEELRFMNNVFLTSEGRAGGELEVETVLARVKYQFDLGSFKPYLGVGVGQSDLSVEAVYGMSVGSVTGAQPPFATGSDSATALELRAGVEYQLSDAFGVFLEYTSTDVDDVEFSRRGGGPGGLATTTQSGHYEFDSLNLGVNFRF